jgi:nucleoside-diphosphate-sugar epimerase
MYPFDRFTERAKRILTLAQEEAERSHHSFIGTEHLQLGLLRDQECLAALALKNLGVEFDKAQAAVEAVLGRGGHIAIRQVIPTSRVKTVIETAFEEAKRMGQNHVGTEHILLGLLIEGEGVAAHVLLDMGVTIDKVRLELEGLWPQHSEAAGALTRASSLRVIVLGGTRFIGRAIVEELVAQGSQPLVIHRGENEPAGMPGVRHLHVERAQLKTVGDQLSEFRPDVVIDTGAMNRRDAALAVAVLPLEARSILLSSCDVYRAFASLYAGIETDAVPLDETSPLRERHTRVQRDEYEKLDAEDLYRVRGATILRLGAVYGPHDYQRREEFILRRVRAKRERIPIGAGTFLFSRVYVRDVARAVRLAAESAHLVGQVVNLAESSTWSTALLARQILDAAGSDAELVRVHDDSLLPEDLKITGTQAQHLLLNSNKARRMLQWAESDPMEALRQTVAWHLEHPPEDSDPDFQADNRALAAVYL